jgi:Integrase core domain.
MLEVLKRERTSVVDQTITMSKQEMERLKMIVRIKEGKITVIEAAESLHLSERHMYRVLARYRTQGEAGLVHRLRGTTSNRGYSKEIQKKACRLYLEQYSDYDPTLFSEKLEEYHTLRISRQTLTRWLFKESLWAGKRKKRPHRKKRERREAIGSLIQFDGSDHNWFEERSDRCCLLVAIDDASGCVMVRFAKEEDTASVLEFWKRYIQQHDIPTEIYTDGGAVYFETKNPKRLTQFGRAIAALGIHHIHAYSPQAKGRVERSNRTHQDRLLKALREENISSIEEANRFVEEVYCAQHNRRFAHNEGLSDIHRPADGIDLDNIFCWEETRKVYNDYTITWHSQFIQLLRSEVPLPPPRSTVTVRRWLDGSLHIFWNEHELDFQVCATRPQLQRKPLVRPAINHPWRNKFVGGKRALLQKGKTLALKPTEQYYNTEQSSEKKDNRRKDSTRYARSVFPSNDTSP